MSTNIRNNADNSLGITTDGSGQLSLIPNANYAAPITLSNASITTSATSMLVTNGNPLQPPGNNLLSPDTTIGFSLGTSTGRDQTYVNGFYMNQDGDVLTPTNKTRYVFTYTGGDQSFTVPANVTWIYVKLWGAGGGAGRQGGWVYGADGGGGGHTRGLIPVTPGATIYVVVGSGGYTCNSNICKGYKNHSCSQQKKNSKGCSCSSQDKDQQTSRTRTTERENIQSFQKNPCIRFRLQ